MSRNMRFRKDEMALVDKTVNDPVRRTNMLISSSCKSKQIPRKKEPKARVM